MPLLAFADACVCRACWRLSARRFSATAPRALRTMRPYPAGVRPASRSASPWMRGPAGVDQLFAVSPVRISGTSPYNTSTSSSSATLPGIACMTARARCRVVRPAAPSFSEFSCLQRRAHRVRRRGRRRCVTTRVPSRRPLRGCLTTWRQQADGRRAAAALSAGQSASACPGPQPESLRRAPASWETLPSCRHESSTARGRGVRLTPAPPGHRGAHRH